MRLPAARNRLAGVVSDKDWLMSVIASGAARRLGVDDEHLLHGRSTKRPPLRVKPAEAGVR